jgi:hypothetical protein
MQFVKGFAADSMNSSVKSWINSVMDNDAGYIQLTGGNGNSIR